jgi:hypothetical protein
VGTCSGEFVYELVYIRAVFCESCWPSSGPFPADSYQLIQVGLLIAWLAVILQLSKKKVQELQGVSSPILSIL